MEGGGCVEIAVNGIDGAGKSTFIEKLEVRLREEGISVAVIDCPYFRRTKGFSRASPVLERVGNQAERFSRILFGGYMFCVVLLYWLARWRTRGVEVLLVEHHPHIDLVPYAQMYGARIGVWFARRIRHFWPEPDGVILLTVSPEESVRRIQVRGRPRQWRQTTSRLNALQELMRDIVKENSCWVHNGCMTAEELITLIQQQKVIGRTG